MQIQSSLFGVCQHKNVLLMRLLQVAEVSVTLDGEVDDPFKNGRSSILHSEKKSMCCCYVFLRHVIQVKSCIVTSCSLSVTTGSWVTIGQYNTAWGCRCTDADYCDHA